MFEFSVLLINKVKIDITREELPVVQAAIKAKDPCIIIGDRSFSHHQFTTILPKAEADFLEKQRLREKGFYKCRKYGTIHKLGETCNCKDTGDHDPRLLEANNLLQEKNV